MGRVGWIAFLLGLAPLSCGQLSFDDENVVAASMATLFTPADWISPYWKEGDVVLVDSQWFLQGRTSFREAVEEFRVFSRSAKACIGLRELQKATQEAKSWVPADPLDLKTMILRPRVIVGETEPSKVPYLNWLPGKRRALGVKPRPTIRALLEIQAPGYSPSGEYAVVKARVPWSMHAARVSFFLKRSSANWVVMQVSPVFFD